MSRWRSENRVDAWTWIVWDGDGGVWRLAEDNGDSWLMMDGTDPCT